MQHTLSSPPEKLPDLGSKPSFNVLIAYEDFETGKHAKRTYDFLVETLGTDCQFSNQMWKFDVLSIPKLRELASADARAADLVVISCHGDELPATTKQWIESWVAGADGPIALGALFDKSGAPGPFTREVREYLASVARRGHMEFFAQPDERPYHQRAPQDPTHAAEHWRSGRATEQQHTLNTLAGVFDRDLPPSRWDSTE